ncbi:MAG: sugar-binding domain-containing protein [Eubacteriales bacterium]|nr:sugar-binding domain-containing protein [Eubacteriales bacterium]
MDINRSEMVHVCRLYYEKNMTQQQIASEMNISRMKVSRLLQKARDEGIVRITIDYSGIYPELEERIADKYTLKKVMVIESSSEAGAKEEVASGAANYLVNRLREGMTIAVGWGTTLKLVPDKIAMSREINVLFVPMIGGHGQSELDSHASSIAADFAKKMGGHAYSLIAPAFVANAEERRIFLQNEQVQQVLGEAQHADCAVFSLGNPLAEGNSIGKSGYISQKDWEELKGENAICDVISTVFLNGEGEECCKDITDRCIALHGDELKRIPEKICIVQGKEKAKAVSVALKSGFIDVLVIDKEIAENLV